MSIKIKAKIIKEVFRNGDFRILSASPIGEDYKSVKVSDYGTFSLKGELPYLDVGTEYDLELEELETTKYGTAYKVLSVPSLTQIDLDKLSLDESKKILCTFTTDRQADNILKAYPNFISLVVNQGKESIDTSKIYGVGEVYMSAYARELTSKYKYLHVLNKYKDYGINITDCKALYKEFGDELIDKGLKEKPYYSLIEVLDRSFDRADKLLRELREDLIESEQRAEFMVLDVLHRNENDGSTKLNAKDLWDYCHEYDNRLLPYVRKVCENSELIYFNSENNDVAIMSTYLGEVKVADFVKEKLSNNHKLNIDCSKYKKVDDFELSDMQLNCLKNFCDYDVSILAGSSGSGKAQPNKTIIPTPSGDKYLGDLKIGDYVFDRFGNSTKVIGVYPKGMRDNYKVTLSDGRFTYCNDEHLWTYIDSHKKYRTQTLKEMIDNGYYYLSGSNHRVYKYKIPTNKEVEYDEKSLYLHPYLLGSFIGNGCCSERPLTLSSNDKEQVEKVGKLLNAKPIKLHEKNYSWNFERLNKYVSKFNGREVKYIQSKEILGYLYGLKSGEKYIPKEYLESSILQRYELLNGLLDTDGSIVVNEKRFNITYSTTSKQLAKDVVLLVNSLGMVATIHIDKRENKNACYSVQILCDNNKKSDLFSLKRKKDKAELAKQVKIHRNYDHISIVNIEKMNKQEEMTCIMVDNKEHLYLTNDYIVTHNTASVKNLIRMMEDNNISYVLLSSTGKASKVLAESTNRNASTIHRRCFQGDINCDACIVDEFGMVSLDVMCMLINAITNPNCKLVFIGDLAQIASINLGKIFEDMVKSEVVPTTNLTEIFRYKSNGSLFVATNARNGKSFFNDDSMVKHIDNKYIIGNNYKFIESDDDKIIDTVVNEYKNLLKKGVNKKDILILSSMNVHELGTRAINRAIQDEVNPPIANEKTLTRKVDGDTITFRVDSMVINCKNDYNAISLEAYEKMKEDSILTEEDVADAFVMNGQIGIVRDIVNDGMIVQYDESLIFVSKSKLKNMLLAFSISTYKAQGSSTDYTINVISKQHSKMLSRGLVYVADTRNRKSCIDIGSLEAYENALKVVDNDLRDTFLLELLKEDSNETN